MNRLDQCGDPKIRNACVTAYGIHDPLRTAQGCSELLRSAPFSGGCASAGNLFTIKGNIAKSRGYGMEARVGIEPTNKGFAVTA